MKINVGYNWEHTHTVEVADDYEGTIPELFQSILASYAEAKVVTLPETRGWKQAVAKLETISFTVPVTKNQEPNQYLIELALLFSRVSNSLVEQASKQETFPSPDFLFQYLNTEAKSRFVDFKI